MVESILALCAAIASYLAALGLDKIIGKWLAYFTIAWENNASEASKAAFDQAMSDIKKSMPDKTAAWDAWRDRAKSAN